MSLFITTGSAKTAVPLWLVPVAKIKEWLEKQPKEQKAWFKATGFEGKARQFALVQDVKTGKLAFVVAVVDEKDGIWAIAHLPDSLPPANYSPNWAGKGDADLAEMALGWQLATYRFKMASKDKPKEFAVLALPEKFDLSKVKALAEGIFLARDLINSPANVMTPYALAEEAQKLAKKHRAKIKVIKDEELLVENYPLVHAVGRASENRPCLIDFTWNGGGAKAKKVTLVGKGICFDSGGLDIKPSSGMKTMKKDMGGAATVLGLAHAIMALKLPVRLRVLIPAAENSISANAFRPLDVITSRKGLTVEIGNTDAEGRLVLCDALTEADREKPDLLVDFATLTGAARVAVGTEIAAFFTPDEALAADMEKHSSQTQDALWRLPLWEGYRNMLNSDVADMNSAPDSGYAGAITAALYLKEFVEQTKTYAHIDLMAWNLRSRPGRPAGGEAMGLRALFALVEERYGKL